MGNNAQTVTEWNKIAYNVNKILLLEDSDVYNIRLLLVLLSKLVNKINFLMDKFVKIVEIGSRIVFNAHLIQDKAIFNAHNIN